MDCQLKTDVDCQPKADMDCEPLVDMDFTHLCSYYKLQNYTCNLNFCF